LRPTFYRTLAVKVKFLVKKLGAVALNYLDIQEINPWFLPSFLQSQEDTDKTSVKNSLGNGQGEWKLLKGPALFDPPE
jgi:hypothetical protein